MRTTSTTSTRRLQPQSRTRAASGVLAPPSACAETAAQLAASLDEAQHLRLALEHSREIAAAVGILMERHHLSYDEAFVVLRRSSNNRNAPLRDVAAELLETGMIQDAPAAGKS